MLLKISYLGNIQTQQSIPSTIFLQLNEPCPRTSYRSLSSHLIPTASSDVELSKASFRPATRTVCNRLRTQAKQSKMPSLLGRSGRVLREERQDGPPFLLPRLAHCDPHITMRPLLPPSACRRQLTNSILEIYSHNAIVISLTP